MTTAQSSAPGWDAPAEGPPEVDPDLVAELVESFGAEFLVELRESACAEAPDQFDDLTKAVAEVDPVAGERALHALKGTASSLGLLAFAEAAEAALARARGGAAPDQAVHDALSAHWTRALAAYDSKIPEEG